MARSHYKKIPARIKKRISATLRSGKLPEPWRRKMTDDDRRRYFMLLECLSCNLNENEDLVDCLYRLRSERDAAFEKLARLCIEPKFKFYLGS